MLQAAGRRAEGATRWPEREGVGGYPPPAGLELSKSLQMHLVLPGRVPAPLVA